VVVLAVSGGRVQPELAEAMRRATALVEGAGVHGTSLAQIAERAAWSTTHARSVLAALERSQAATRAGDLWFSRGVVDRARARAIAHFEQAPRLTIIEFKALCGLPRRQAILLLEHFDAVGLTRRVGNARERT
jgi:selenocysteine-specific elongation factor